MAIEGNFNLKPENPYSGDPSVGRFTYLPNERTEMVKELMAQGLTEEAANDAVTAKEVEITNKQLQKAA